MKNETSIKTRKIAVWLFGIVLSVVFMILLTVGVFYWARPMEQSLLSGLSGTTGTSLVDQSNKFLLISFIFGTSVLVIFAIAYLSYCVALFIEWFSGLTVFDPYNLLRLWFVIETLLFYFVLLWFLLP